MYKITIDQLEEILNVLQSGAPDVQQDLANRLYDYYFPITESEAELFDVPPAESYPAEDAVLHHIKK